VPPNVPTPTTRIVRAAAAKTTLHNPIRHTPSFINPAACQEACELFPDRLLHPVKRTVAAGAQKKRPSGRFFPSSGLPAASRPQRGKSVLSINDSSTVRAQCLPSRGSVDVPFLALRTDSSCLSVALPRPIDAQELAHQIACGRYRLVDALGLGREIRVEGAHDDASVDRRLLMQANEVLSRVRTARFSAVAKRRTSVSGTASPALPVSLIVRTSCPRLRSAWTTGSGKFSLP
jgi:hypothetical protein